MSTPLPSLVDSTQQRMSKIAALEWTARTKLWTTMYFCWFMAVMAMLLLVRLAWSVEFLALGGTVRP